MVGMLLVQAMAKLLLLPILVTAVAILVNGYNGPGDGFSAGVIAASGVLLQFVAFPYRPIEGLLGIRYTATMALGGLLAALVVAFYPLLLGQSILQHQPPPSAPAVRLGALELIGAFAFDVAVFFIVVGFVVGTIMAIARTSQRRAR